MLVKCAMNEGCNPGRQWVFCNKDSSNMAFRGAEAFEGKGGQVFWKDNEELEVPDHTPGPRGCGMGCGMWDEG